MLQNTPNRREQTIFFNKILHTKLSMILPLQFRQVYFQSEQRGNHIIIKGRIMLVPYSPGEPWWNFVSYCIFKDNYHTFSRCYFS